MKIELCDICKLREPSKKFKVKLSLKGCWQCTGSLNRWNANLWRPYEKIAICESCAYKLFNVFEEDV